MGMIEFSLQKNNDFICFTEIHREKEITSSVRLLGSGYDDLLNTATER